MLAMMAVIVDYTFKMSGDPPKRHGAWGNLPPYSPSRQARVL